MAKRKSAGQRRKAAEQNSALRNIGIAGAVVGALVYGYWQASSGHKKLDEVTLCPPEPSSVAVLLVDVTDPMNLPQRQDFLNQLDRLSASIPRYGKLVIAKVDPVSDRLLSPIITRCNPGTAKDESELSGNPQKVEKLHRENYEAPLRAAYETLLTATGADRSPILESTQSVALTELQRSGDVPKRLVVASDLLQYTDSINFYRSLPQPSEFIASQAFSRVRTDLRGVEVELWMLQRGDSVTTQPRELPDLWDQIVSAQGGTLTRLYTVSG